MRRKRSTVKVTLRSRMLNTGKEALYLDYYPPIINPDTNKESRRESLGMYVTPLKNKNGDFLKDKQGRYKYTSTDMEFIEQAQIICNLRQNELYKQNIYTDAEADILKAKERSKGDFIQFFKQMANEKRNTNQDNWISAYKHLVIYTQKTDKNDSIRFCDITLQWCEGFKSYLLTTNSQRSEKTKLANNKLETTMVYAKTLEEAKREAVEKIKIF